MREIKFRAWNKRRKKMDYCGDLYWFEENYVRDSDDNYWILMQYTGLKDKSGVEIYEGDIIQNEYGSKMVVKYKEIQESDDMTAPGIGYQFYTYTEEMEVIGNIHENPELLVTNNDENGYIMGG
jgi:uncharacterized phage protein (TIGR01671 family)